MRLQGLDVPQVKVKIGLDNGKGHLTMILSMYDPSTLMLEIKESGRVTREKGIGSGEEYSFLGKEEDNDPCNLPRHSRELLQSAYIL